jgi:hypothetical protein
MVGMGSSPGRLGVLAVASPDPVLSILSALGMAQAAGSALVIDMCLDLALESGRTLSDLAAEGPSLSELSPGRSGVALLSFGPMEPDEALPLIDQLAQGWPAVVIRCPRGRWPGPTIPVRPLLPGLLRSLEDSPGVWQPMAAGARPTGPGPVLPRLSGALVRRLLSGRSAGRARWVRAWERVWEMPWA